MGTLVNLKYRHVKKDLEAGKIPLHVHVEAEITKGKYHDYDTFLGTEAVEYLKVYLDMRRKGTRNDRWGMPPEMLYDESPLIRDSQTKTVKPVTTGSIYLSIHKLFVKAGIIRKGTAKALRPQSQSIRKYFRTQIGSLSTIPTDYIEYMIGTHHKHLQRRKDERDRVPPKPVRHMRIDVRPRQRSQKSTN